MREMGFSMWRDKGTVSSQILHPKFVRKRQKKVKQKNNGLGFVHSACPSGNCGSLDAIS